MLFVGHTRFSLFNPRSSSWRATSGRFSSPEAYRDYLYDDERLGVRSDFFINLSLPQIEMARAGHDVLHVVSYSDSLPRKHQVMLEKAAEKFPFLVLDRHEHGRKPIDLVELARERIQATTDGGVAGEAFATYRLDDDDLISKDYFAQMSPYVTPQNAGMQVSLATGITGLLADGSFSNFRESYWPMHSMGHLNVCAFQDDGTARMPSPAPHNLSDRTNPVIVDARKPAYFWLRHLTQDTSIDYSPTEARASLVQSMQRYPSASSTEDVLSAFPVLRDRVLGETPIPVVENTVSLNGSPILAIFPDPLSSFAISADIEATAGVLPNNALISFSLVDEGGQPVDKSHAPALAAAGLTRSSNDEVGFYRYVSTQEGRHGFNFATSLPQGVRCGGLSIRRWGASESDVLIHSLTAEAI